MQRNFEVKAPPYGWLHTMQRGPAKRVRARRQARRQQQRLHKEASSLARGRQTGEADRILAGARPPHRDVGATHAHHGSHDRHYQ
jgi:hypothetical protein